MIDLRQKGLPKTVLVAGTPFLIKTDFRIWLEFGEKIKDKKCQYKDLLFVFEHGIPIGLDFVPALVDFYVNANATPKKDDGTNEKILDYILDGEYIVGSFMQAYNIDLTECDMHWHLFKALFLSLPQETKIKEIMSIRAWHKSNDKHDTMAQKAKNAWSLPTMSSEEEKAIMNEINDLFYNS